METNNQQSPGLTTVPSFPLHQGSCVHEPLPEAGLPEPALTQQGVVSPETPSKESILKKTHNGLRIYAHVLQQYYPAQTILSLSGRDCQPARNPFNGNKPTLYISITNDGAVHHDSEVAAIKGDAFSFAALHYQLEGEALYHKLNEVMHLHLGKPFDFYQRQQVLIQQPASPVANKAPLFSYFKNPVTNIYPARQTNLSEVYHLIKSDSFITVTDTLRNMKDAKSAKDYKAAHFDYVTFSGTFSKRTDKALEKHSGLLTIDFDHVKDPQLLKDELLEDEYFETELLFISPSGNGLKWIISIDLTKATHQDYFKSISNYILHRYQLKIDPSGKDMSRACFLPHDAGVYLNPKYL